MSLRITWLDPAERFAHELRQLREEGADAAELEAAWSALPPDEQRRRAPDLLRQAGGISLTIRQVPRREDFVEQLRGNPARTFSPDELRLRLQAAWLGRAAGCLLGKPVEKVPREGIRALLESIGAYPLREYFTAEGVPPEVSERYPWNRASRPTSLRENITQMPEDDDLNYTMLNLSVVERFGPECSTEHIAHSWLEMLPVLSVFTAERVAYVNLLHFLRPPQTATHLNPYREWIGAQIRADLWGYIHPGDPPSAARAAFRDARLSHVENGVFGAMLVAAMIAQAFLTRDSEAVVRAGLAVIPPDSRLAEAVRYTLELEPAQRPWEQTLDALYAAFGHYHWVHTINNAALVVAALLYGRGDYERSITAAVMGGWDTDCNGATVGSIVGLMNAQVPAKWIDPLRNRLRTSLKGFDHSRFDELASRTLEVVPARYRSI
ncbi:ADP-ribosylglycohydrolase family protein [Calidithermus roseus]|uniref:ADP-ribosylglycohydrolase n=1 Tax=Calidithermus roseus TaxID=1644118 RepID=A0A399ELK1_9DEIN|nr:ADP-ribosylglycohydrolase family protein [Calidithermus roseus]RIH84280.1 ADP-ribosylglycohydrolase [Calidithermus roseus]